MKSILSKTPLPLQWAKLVPEARLLGHVTLSRGSRLRMKLVVFDTPAALRRFWRETLGKGDLGRDCRGAVQSLAVRHENPSTGRCYIEYDSRHFAVMGLCRQHLGMEIITHESVHAAFCYARRVRHRNPWHDINDCDEESVCYPAGIIARSVTCLLRENGLIP